MRKTRIIATLGPATESSGQIAELIKAGVNIFRLNMSHAKHDWVRQVVSTIRDAAQQQEKIIGVLMDMQGPSIRTGDLPAPLSLQAGDKITLSPEGSSKPGSISVLYPSLTHDLKLGDLVLIDNGQIELRVVEHSSSELVCEVLIGGLLKSRRHLNLPGIAVKLPALTDKDLQDLALALEVKVDFLAMSFVRDAGHVRELKSKLPVNGWRPRIVSKIEDQQAIRNLEEIVRESDAVMVARGDLGIEAHIEELPVLQRRIVQTCFKVGRPVITATHLLESMIENPVPTRAEVSDVANAIFEGADSLMLSGETTVGKHPVRAVQVMDRLIQRMEQEPSAGFQALGELRSSREHLARSAILLCNGIKATALVVFTTTGKMPRHCAWMRPEGTPIVAVCQTEELARQVVLHRGVLALVLPWNFDYENNIGEVMQILKKRGLLASGNSVVWISTQYAPVLTDSLHVRVV